MKAQTQPLDCTMEMLASGQEIIRKPKLPASYLEKHPQNLLRYLVRMGLMWTVPALISASILTAGVSWWLAVPTFILFGWLTGFGMACGQWLGHDAAHGALLKNRKAGMMLGNFFASATPFYSNTGFSKYHLDHHKYVNGEKDEDVWYYSQFNTLWERLILVRIKKNRAYLKATWSLWRDNTGFASFSARETRQIILANLASSLAWLGFYGWLATVWPELFFTLVVAPTLALAIGTGCLTYQQHADTDAVNPNDYWRNARSLTSRFWTLLYTGGNFHLEHHLYPAVPVWNLPKVHRFLKLHGYLSQPGLHLDASNFGGYKYFSPVHRYPVPAAQTDVTL
ncbi:MAG: fatty acid desaturase [Marinobacter sp.]|nr:fatty acid desaturase [Marinobacter sp.]